LREALAKQTPGDAHPSADALTAFVEHNLPQSESQRVTAHLAQCADCREVVFLAGSAVEEPVGNKQESMAAVAPRRSAWRLWWVWAPAVAALVIVSAVVIQQRSGPGHSEQTSVAVNSAPLAPTASQPQPEMRYKVPERQKLPAKATRVPGTQQRSIEGITGGSTTLQAHQEYPSAPTVPIATQPAGPPVLSTLGGAAKAAPAVAPTHNAFVDSEGQNTTAVLEKSRPVMEKPQMAIRSVNAARSQWRISSDGHLEHLTSPGSWTTVLTDQPSTFRVVSVVGSNVWAGGSGGTLFHSSDGGQNWSRQPLDGETGTIISIQFSDAAHGVVTTNGGSRWSTSDGGVSWNKE